MGFSRTCDPCDVNFLERPKELASHEALAVAYRMDVNDSQQHHSWRGEQEERSLIETTGRLDPNSPTGDVQDSGGPSCLV